MGSLSDSSDFGAAPTGDQRFYGSERVGLGRWVLLPRLGLLWTNDIDGLQLSVIPDADDTAANELRYRLIAARRSGIPASKAFDLVVNEFAAGPVQSGDLSTLL